METIVGIDLGTTNSAIAIMQGEEVKILPNDGGDNTTPSVVAVLKDKVLVGKVAKNQAASNPERTIASVKRLMGRRVAEVPDASKKVPYTLVGRPTDPVQILVDSKPYMPQAISSKVLTKLKEAAEAHLGKKITSAVITVPAYFNDAQRHATKKAGELAGLEVKRIINEPTAAALAYGIALDDEKDRKVAVFDLGGGTFDISILEIGGGVWEVKSTNGDTYLGGDDFDREIINLLVRSHLNNTGTDLREYPSAMQRLKDAAEIAKHELSNAFEAKINIPFLDESLGADSHFEFTLTRVKFEDMISKYLKKVETCCKQALKDAALRSNDITDVVLVGGSTRVPAVKALAEKIFGKVPNTSVNPDEVVALGAAIQGAILTGDKKDMVLVDVTPLSLGIETEYEVMDVLIPRNTQIPCVAKEIYTTTDDDQEEVDVVVYQGESRRITRNRLLGQFVLDGIEPTFAGEPQIEVRFAIDANGILNVSAKNLATGSAQNITIKDSSGLSDEDVKRMQNAAEMDQYDSFDDDEDEDDEYTLENLVVAADSLLQDTTAGLTEFASSLSAEIVTKLKTAKEQLAMALDEEDIEAIDTRMAELLGIWDSIEDQLDLS